MKHAIRLLLAGFCILLVAVGCSLFPLTIQTRLDRFIADINLGEKSARADTYLNFDEGIALYAAIQGYDSSGDYYWDIYFPQTAPPSVYSISDIDASDPSNVTAVISCPGVPSFGTRDARFVMVQGSDFSYRISELWLDQMDTLTQIIW